MLLVVGIYQPDEHIDRQAQKKHKRHKHKIDKEGWFPMWESAF